jgi:hypothetical protein
MSESMGSTFFCETGPLAVPRGRLLLSTTPVRGLFTLVSCASSARGRARSGTVVARHRGRFRDRRRIRPQCVGAVQARARRGRRWTRSRPGTPAQHGESLNLRRCLVSRGVWSVVAPPIGAAYRPLRPARDTQFFVSTPLPVVCQTRASRAFPAELGMTDETRLARHVTASLSPCAQPPAECSSTSRPRPLPHSDGDSGCLRPRWDPPGPPPRRMR